jgi:hypothetical protein
MKLAAKNPNLLKANKSVGLGTFAQTSGDLGHVKERRGYTPPKRNSSLVPASALNVWDRPVYVSPSYAPMRAGADDHQSIRSHGLST